MRKIWTKRGHCRNRYSVCAIREVSNVSEQSHVSNDTRNRRYPFKTVSAWLLQASIIQNIFFGLSLKIAEWYTPISSPPKNAHYEKNQTQNFSKLPLVRENFRLRKLNIRASPMNTYHFDARISTQLFSNTKFRLVLFDVSGEYLDNRVQTRGPGFRMIEQFFSEFSRCRILSSRGGCVFLGEGVEMRRVGNQWCGNSVKCTSPLIIIVVEPVFMPRKK